MTRSNTHTYFASRVDKVIFFRFLMSTEARGMRSELINPHRCFSIHTHQTACYRLLWMSDKKNYFILISCLMCSTTKAPWWQGMPGCVLGEMAFRLRWRMKLISKGFFRAGAAVRKKRLMFTFTAHSFVYCESSSQVLQEYKWIGERTALSVSDDTRFGRRQNLGLLPGLWL